MITPCVFPTLGPEKDFKAAEVCLLGKLLCTLATLNQLMFVELLGSWCVTEIAPFQEDADTFKKEAHIIIVEGVFI